MTPTEISQSEALARAIKVVGSQSELARRIASKQQHVSHWLKTGRIPADICPAIERETRLAGQVVVCEELCDGPDWGELRAKHAAQELATADASES